jgi:hypothetical protein
LRNRPGKGAGLRVICAIEPDTKPQTRQLRELSRRIIRAIDPDNRRPDDQALPAAMPAQSDDGHPPARGVG